MDTSAYYQSSRTDMLFYIPPNIRTCLDIGCSSGNFAKSIKDRVPGIEVWGVEIFKEAGNEAAKKIDRVIVASAEEALADLPDHYFDCIVFNDSLEHFVNPFAYLSAIRQKLKPDGVVVASIPNIRHYKVLFDLLFQAEWQYVDAGVLDRTHLRFFTQSSMRRMFEEAGFTVSTQQGLSGTRKVKVRIWSWLTLGMLEDIRFPQFAIVAKNPSP